MDEIDKKILNTLQKNAKANMKMLADELNISKSRDTFYSWGFNISVKMLIFAV